jgi:hypothetical protein
MGKPREDGLPAPYSSDQLYLAAILDALRELTIAVNSLGSDKDVPAPPQQEGEVILLSEPQVSPVEPPPLAPETESVAKKPRGRPRKAKA